MQTKAYRNPVQLTDSIPEAPLQEYRALAKQIELQCLHAEKLNGRATSADQQIDQLTADWSNSERERFRYWFRNTRSAGGLATAESKMTTKTAQYLPFAHQEALDKFKEKRRSMVRRLRRLQNELFDAYEQSSKVVNWSDENYPTPEKKIEAIQNAINQICNLLNTLKTKEVTAAALTRTVGHLRKIDSFAAVRVTKVLNDNGGIVRVAANGSVQEIANKLKQELDNLNYGLHLRRFFHLYEALHNLGLSGIAGDLEDVIQKELGNLTSISKKLGEIYSDLLKIPAKEKAPSETPEEVKPPGAERFKTPEDVGSPTL